VNASWLAYATGGGGGPVVVVPRLAPRRLGAVVPKVQIHKAPVVDVAFCPFNDFVMATASEDGYVKLSQIPTDHFSPENQNDVTTALVTFEGHGRKVLFVSWHPVAKDIVVSASADNTVKIWNVDAGAEAINWEIPELPFCLEWNDDGSRLMTVTKDKKVRIVDPRDTKTVLETDGFAGTKSQRTWFADNIGPGGYVVGAGQGKGSARQWAMWDSRNFAKPISGFNDIDQGAGSFLGQVDSDNNVWYLGGTGDASIKYFELDVAAPYVHPLSEFRNTESTYSLCWLPKRNLDVAKCEIAHCYRVLPKDAIIPISFQVPRKSDVFQKDLYPDAYAGVPALDSKQYLAGENAKPIRTSMQPGQQQERKVEAVTAKRSPADMQAEIDALKAEVARLTAENAALKAK
jgi:hypothetical protein